MQKPLIYVLLCYGSGSNDKVPASRPSQTTATVSTALPLWYLREFVSDLCRVGSTYADLELPKRTQEA